MYTDSRATEGKPGILQNQFQNNLTPKILSIHQTKFSQSQVNQVYKLFHFPRKKITKNLRKQ